MTELPEKLPGLLNTNHVEREGWGPLTSKLAELHNMGAADFKEVVADRVDMVKVKLHENTINSAAGATGAMILTGFGLAFAAPVVSAVTFGAAVAFAGSVAYNLIRQKFGDHERTAINELRKEAINAHVSAPLSSASSMFVSRVFSEIRQSAMDIKRDLDVALQRFSNIPAYLNTARVELNQKTADKVKAEGITAKAIPMTSSGLYTLRQVIARQIQGFSDIVNPDVKTKSMAEMAALAGDKVKTFGASIAQKVMAEATVAAAPLLKASHSASENVTDRMALVKSFMARVQSAYLVLKGEAQIAPVPAARFIQPLQSANSVSAAIMAPAIAQAQQVREARVEGVRELAMTN
jgi:hypothetical protein